MMTDLRVRSKTQQRKLPPWWHVAVLTAVAALSAGCSDGRPTRVPVSGQVLIDGQPLTVGNIKFVPDGARASSGKLDSQGRFTLTCYDGEDGVVPGRHRAQISAMEVISASKVKWLAPPKYADFRTSELEFEINEPTDDLKITLTWEGSPPGKPFVQ
jgi:hypothetical protein